MTAAIASGTDRPAKREMLRELSARIDRCYATGELTFREWASLMATLLRPATRRRADFAV